MDAALALFAERGFHNTSVPDIVQAARVGHGTFYEYFENRRDVLLQVTRELRLDPARIRRKSATPASLAEAIRLDLIWWLSDFVDNLDLSKVWVEATAFDPEVREARYKLREVQLSRIRRGIELSKPDGIDPAMAAEALLAMTEEFAQRWFVEGRGDGSSPREVIAAAETIANLWINAVRAEGIALSALATTNPGDMHTHTDGRG